MHATVRNILILAAAVALISALLLSARQDPLERILGCLAPSDTSGVKPGCMEDAVASALKSMSVAETLSLVSSQNAPEDVYANCHAIAHEIGKQTYQGSDGLETALSSCTGTCGEGCIHGAVGQAVLEELGTSYDDLPHLDESELTAIGAKYCAKSTALCHAMGHLLFMASHDFYAAVSGCDTVASATTSERCYRGVYMEGIGGQAQLNVEDDEERRIDENRSLSYPCDTAQPGARHACFSYLPRYQQIVFEASGVTDPKTRLERRRALCESLNVARDRSSCLEGIGFSSSARETPPSDVRAQRGFCETLAGEDRTSCMFGEISGMIQYQRYTRGISYCTAQMRDDIGLCFDAVFTIMQAEPLSMNDGEIRAACSASGTRPECETRFESFLERRASVRDYMRGRL